jgi:Domain of unknown function (DUF3883)
MANAGEEWTDAEVRATVSDYLVMLAAEAAGESYSKTLHRRALLAELEPGRTQEAVEFKHMNISAAMIDLGLPYIRGYAPHGNYQAELVTELERRLRDPLLLAAITPLTASAPAQRLQLKPPPAPRSRVPAGRHLDYGALQEENRRRGHLGEQLVFDFEQRQLNGAGRPDLAGRVRWVARDDGDGLGYDILSFDAAGRERHIEVKATALGSVTPFYISSAELEFARRHPASFELYRVYDVLAKPSFYVLYGDISTVVDLEATVYRARLKSGEPDPAGLQRDRAVPPPRHGPCRGPVTFPRSAQRSEQLLEPRRAVP